MAASITLATPVIAADGKTMTATISGGSGTGYAITSATGLAPHFTTGPNGGANTFVVSSVSISGTTLTMNLASSVGSAESMRLDIAITSNLTDSAANTPTGQTNIVVTNNSAVTVATFYVGTNPELFEINGLHTSIGVTGSLRGTGTVVTGAATGDAYIEFVADATEIALIANGSVTSTARVDGATSNATLAANGTSWTIKPVASGLTAGKHLVLLDYGDFFTGVRLVGSTRTLATVATTKRTVLPNTSSYLGVPASTEVAAWGTYKTNVAGDGIASVASFAGFLLECSITGSGLAVASVLDPNTNWAVSIDGGLEGRLVAASDAIANQNGYSVLAAGLATGSHTIHATLVGANTATNNRLVKVINGTATTASSAIGATTLTVASTSTLAVGDWVKIDYYSKREWRQITAISSLTITLNATLAQAHASGIPVTSYSAPAGTISAWVKKDLSTKRLVAIGDSNTAGANEYGLGEAGYAVNSPDGNGNYYAWYDPRQGAVFRGADPLSIDVVNLGIQGQTTAQMAARTADFATFGKSSYDYLTVWGGTNDINGTSVTPTAFQASVETIVTAAIPFLRTGGKVVLMPPGTPNGVTNAGGLNLATALTALQNVAANHSTTTVVATNLLNGLTTGLPDRTGVHYGESGRVKLGANLQPYLGATATTPAAVLTGMFAAAS